MLRCWLVDPVRERSDVCLRKIGESVGVTETAATQLNVLQETHFVAPNRPVCNPSHSGRSAAETLSVAGSAKSRECVVLDVLQG